MFVNVIEPYRMFWWTNAFHFSGLLLLLLSVV